MESAEPLPVAPGTLDPMCTLSINVSTPAGHVDHLLQILREGVTNVRRHAKARTASVHVDGAGEEIVVRIEDDGVGFADDGDPWSIRSRVRELGGRLEVGRDGGGHLTITLPRV
jgi:signal transduction histidine kinase